MTQHHDYDEPGRIAGPCLIQGMPIEKYHGGEGISKSGLDEIALSPRRWWGSHRDPKRPKEERKETAAQLIGNMAHCILLEPERFDARYRVGPEVSNKNVKAWQTFKGECEAIGASAIDSEQYDMAMRMSESALAHPVIRKYLRELPGVSEESAYWWDPETGVLCRCRPDRRVDVGDGAVVLADVKTYSDASTDEFARQVARMRYHVQAAFYSDGYQLVSRKQVNGFLFIAIEVAHPHVCNVMMLDAASHQVGRELYRRDLNRYAECLKADVWPGHGEEIYTIELPRWAMKG